MLAAMEDAGAIESIGRGKRRPVQPGSAWLEGAVALGTDEPNDPLIVGVLLSKEPDENWEHQLRIAMNRIQRAEDVGIELRYWRREDIEAATTEMLSELAQVQMIFGPHPLDIAGARQAAEALLGQVRPRIHADRETESLERAQAISESERAKRMRQSLPSALVEPGARERRGETKHELG